MVGGCSEHPVDNPSGVLRYEVFRNRTKFQEVNEGMEKVVCFRWAGRDGVG